LQRSECGKKFPAKEKSLLRKKRRENEEGNKKTAHEIELATINLGTKEEWGEREGGSKRKGRTITKSAGAAERKAHERGELCQREEREWPQAHEWMVLEQKKRSDVKDKGRKIRT